MKTTEARNRNAELAALGFALNVLHGPRGDVSNDNDKPWPHIAFKVMLTFKEREVITTDYKLGIGHVDPKKAFIGSVISRPNLTLDEESVLYAWQENSTVQFKNKHLHAEVAAKLARYQKVIPQLDDVLHSLLMDGEAFFNAQSFEDWAGDFGYDKDSRKAEAIYRICDATGRKLSQAVPRETLEKAREIVQDL